MHVAQTHIKGEDFVGLFGFATDEYAILGKDFGETGVLSVPELRTSVYGTNLVGLFCAGNSSGIVLPYFTEKRELDRIKKLTRELGLNIGILTDRHTAIGNLLSVNDNAAIVSPLIKDARVVEDVLGVETLSGPVGGHNEVGAVLVATNKGFLACPDAEKEVSELEGILGVPGACGTVSYGFPFVKSGIIANKNGFVTGRMTTGIELGQIDDALGFI